MICSRQRLWDFKRFAVVALSALLVAQAMNASVFGEERDKRTPILPAYDGRQKCTKPPSLQQLRRALPGSAEGKVVLLVKIDKLVDRADPPRMYPLVGVAQLHHVHWKCQVLVIDPGVLLAPQRQIRTEVIYIDQDHLHVIETRS